jgi:hypothetical protein
VRNDRARKRGSERVECRKIYTGSVWSQTQARLSALMDSALPLELVVLGGVMVIMLYHWIQGLWI